MSYQRFEGWESGELYQKSRDMEIFLQIEQDLPRMVGHLSQQSLVCCFGEDDRGMSLGWLDSCHSYKGLGCHSGNEFGLSQLQ